MLLEVSCVDFSEHFALCGAHGAEYGFVFSHGVDDGDGSLFGDPEACAGCVDDFLCYTADIDMLVCGECVSERLYELFVSLSGKFECAAVVLHGLYV